MKGQYLESDRDVVRTPIRIVCRDMSESEEMVAEQVGRDNPVVIAMAVMSLSPQQYQQMVDWIAGRESMMTHLPDESASAYSSYFSETGD